MRGCIATVKKYDPSTVDLTYKALQSRIYRLLLKWDITYRRRTHKAQNTRFSESICNEFINYVNDKVKMMKVDWEHVYNADQTNVHYSMENSYTYAKKGSKTVTLKGVECSSRCTVMLSTNMTGSVKLKPYIIFKGSAKKTVEFE